MRCWNNSNYGRSVVFCANFRRVTKPSPDGSFFFVSLDPTPR